MPTPDSIDRPAPTSPAPTYQPGLSPWETIFGPPTEPQTVYINPLTRQAVRTTNPQQIALLLTSGFERHIVAPENWASFRQMFGPNLTEMNPTDPVTVPIPGQHPLSAEEQAVLQAGISDTNAQAAAKQENLSKAFGIGQAGRDRAAKQAKEDYGAKVQPTLTAGAFSGAGYHQPLHDLFMGRLSRDRTLAGIADETTAGQFQLSMSQQQTEQERLAALEQAYTNAIASNQNQFNNGIDQFLAWLR